MKVVSATDVIRDDHKRVTGLFRQFEAAKSRAPEMLDGVLGQLFMEIEIHGRVTSEIFYPVVRSALDEDGMGQVEDSIEQHRSAIRGIQTLRRMRSTMKADDPRIEQRLADIIDDMDSHFEEEDRDVLEATERAIPQAELTELGQRMMHRRDELAAQPKYADVQPARTQNPHGGEQKRVA